MMTKPPVVGGGKILRGYQLGPYKAMLVVEPESIGPIRYLYELMVYQDGVKEPCLFVTAEQNSMQADLFKLAREQLHDPSLVHDSNSFFLGVYSPRGRQNLGSSHDWGDLKKFENKALRIACAELGIDPNALYGIVLANVDTAAARARVSGQPARSEPAPFYGVLRAVLLGLAWLFAGLAAMFMIYVMVVNPREFFSNILNPLWLHYFAPAIVCFWGANWAQKKRFIT